MAVKPAGLSAPQAETRQSGHSKDGEQTSQRLETTGPQEEEVPEDTEGLARNTGPGARDQGPGHRRATAAGRTGLSNKRGSVEEDREGRLSS